jgi:hypothetical protein
VTNVVVALEHAVTLSGVVTSDTPPLEGRPMRQPIVIETADPDGGSFSKGALVDGPSGAFMFDDLAPGPYFLRPWGIQQIQSIRAGGRELADQPIDTSRSVAGIEVKLTDPSSIHGNVRLSSAAASVRTAVIYFSSDRQLWTQASSKSPRFGSAYVKTDGTYDTPHLPGGEYYVVAIPHDVRFDGWRSKAYLEAAARVATTLHVDWGRRVQQDLQVQEVRLP